MKRPFPYYHFKDLPAINPNTIPLEADLSRNDIRVLHQLCYGKTVIEFGTGGSTLLLARFSRAVFSYDHSDGWINLVQETVRKRRAEGIRMSKIVLGHVPDYKPPKKLPKVGVMFVDGRRDQRHLWVRAAIKRNLARVIIIHDSRAKKSPIASCQSLLTWPFTLSIDRISYHHDNSNHVVIWLRDEPVVYENWNKTEPDHRLPHLHKQ